MRKRARAITTAFFTSHGRAAAACAAVVFLSPALLPAQSPALDPAVMKDLREKGTLIRAFRGGELPAYAPGTEDGAELAREAAEFSPTVAAEVLRLIPSRGSTSTADGGAAGQTLRLSIVNAMCAVSTMKGIPYWSRSRNQERVLFSESYAVDSPQSLKKIPDPFWSALPAEARVFSVQEDSSFGRNVYLMTVRNGTDGVRARMENVTDVKLLFVTVIPKGGLVSLSLVMPTADGVLFYGISMIRSGFPMGDLQARSESLTNRMTAVADWLKGRLGL